MPIDVRMNAIEPRGKPRYPCGCPTSQDTAGTWEHPGLATLPTTTLADVRTGDQLLEEVNRRISNIDALQLLDMLEHKAETVLIDVRTPEEILLLGGTIDARHG